uniref:Uncharacterized protein n=1 Tax=Anguilla anguilla TaxID=7936 RepID=A0A0E9WE17_ANGAN
MDSTCGSFVKLHAGTAPGVGLHSRAVGEGGGGLLNIQLYTFTLC